MRRLETMGMVGLGLTMTLAGVAGAQTVPRRDTMACVGVPEIAANGAPLTDPDDVRAVQEIKPDQPVSETETVIPRGGARILLRAEPGMTAEWLQRIAECHMAKVAVAVPGTLSTSPLDVRGALVSVQSTGDGFSVDITSPDVKTAREILTRARAIKPLQPIH
ncbi:MAG TPA: hypothetical protein VHL80_09900 [Polyangia bacterium]|nr:hypothetical protein [Polyangia bacterium]